MNDFLKLIEECAGDVIEDELGTTAVLISPDGEKQTMSALDEDEKLKCTVFRESRELDYKSGLEVIADRPVAVFRLRSLERIPKSGEAWLIRVQLSAFSEEMTSYEMSGPPKPGSSIGFINFRLRRVSQT